MFKFYHTIGHTKKDGSVEYKTLYKIERAVFSFRQMIAFIVCPELRVRADSERDHTKYVVSIFHRHTKELRAKEKAYARLRQTVKNLNQKIRELT